MRQEGLAARAIVIAMSEVRSGWSGITRRDGGYRDRYLNRWLWTAGLTLGALLALDVLLVVLADGVLPTIHVSLGQLAASKPPAPPQHASGD